MTYTFYTKRELAAFRVKQAIQHVSDSMLTSRVFKSWMALLKDINKRKGS